MSLTVGEVSFLRGLIAGEGCFGIKLGKSKSNKCGVQVQPAFKISMAEDGDILEILCEKTGLGNVCDALEKNPKRRDAKSWQVFSQGEIDSLIGLLDRPGHDPVEFLLGLIAGEGCFLIGLGKRENYACGVRVRPMFHMDMVEGGDILKILCEKTGLGTVCDKPKKNPKWRDAERWQVQRQEDCDKLIKMIETRKDSLFWETDKGVSFRKWKEAVQIRKNMDTSDPEAVKEMIRISKNLNPGSAGRSEEDWCAIVDEAVAEDEEQEKLETYA